MITKTLCYFFQPPSSVSTPHFSEGVHSSKAQQTTFAILQDSAESTDTSTCSFNTSPKISVNKII